MDWTNIEKIRTKMKELDIFDHEGYSGPAARTATGEVETVTLTMDKRFLIVGTGIYFDTVEEVISFFTGV